MQASFRMYSNKAGNISEYTDATTRVSLPKCNDLDGTNRLRGMSSSHTEQVFLREVHLFVYAKSVCSINYNFISVYTLICFHNQMNNSSIFCFFYYERSE